MPYTIQYLNMNNEPEIAGFASIEKLVKFVNELDEFLCNAEVRKEYIKDLHRELELQNMYFPVNKIN
jgi:hypothetical protein